MRILIADDEPLPRKALAKLVQAAGHQVVGALADGGQVVEWLEANPGAADALFLDVRMPRLNGLEVAGQTDLPVVLVSGYQDYAVRAFEAQVLHYLLKPASRAGLDEALGRVAAALARSAERVHQDSARTKAPPEAPHP